MMSAKLKSDTPTQEIHDASKQNSQLCQFQFHRSQNGLKSKVNVSFQTFNRCYIVVTK